jgi:hypothetical protein
MSQENEMMVILAKNMPLHEITDKLAKNSEKLTSLLKTNKVNPKDIEQMTEFPCFRESTLYAQLLIVKLAYEGKSTIDTLKELEEFKDEFDMKRETDKLRNKNNN